MERIWLRLLLKSDNSNEARRGIREAMTAIENSKETWWEAEVNRIAGEIAHRSPGVDALDAPRRKKVSRPIKRPPDLDALEALTASARPTDKSSCRIRSHAITSPPARSH